MVGFAIFIYLNQVHKCVQNPNVSGYSIDGAEMYSPNPSHFHVSEQEAEKGVHTVKTVTFVWSWGLLLMIDSLSQWMPVTASHIIQRTKRTSPSGNTCGLTERSWLESLPNSLSPSQCQAPFGENYPPCIFILKEKSNIFFFFFSFFKISRASDMTVCVYVLSRV